MWYLYKSFSMQQPNDDKYSTKYPLKITLTQWSMLFFGSNLERGLATIDRTSLPLRTSKYKYYTAKFFF